MDRRTAKAVVEQTGLYDENPRPAWSGDQQGRSTQFNVRLVQKGFNDSFIDYSLPSNGIKVLWFRLLESLPDLVHVVYPSPVHVVASDFAADSYIEEVQKVL